MGREIIPFSGEPKDFSHGHKNIAISFTGADGFEYVAITSDESNLQKEETIRRAFSKSPSTYGQLGDRLVFSLGALTEEDAKICAELASEYILQLSSTPQHVLGDRLDGVEVWGVYPFVHGISVDDYLLADMCGDCYVDPETIRFCLKAYLNGAKQLLSFCHDNRITHGAFHGGNVIISQVGNPPGQGLETRLVDWEEAELTGGLYFFSKRRKELGRMAEYVRRLLRVNHLLSAMYPDPILSEASVEGRQIMAESVLTWMKVPNIPPNFFPDGGSSFLSAGEDTIGEGEWSALTDGVGADGKGLTVKKTVGVLSQVANRIDNKDLY